MAKMIGSRTLAVAALLVLLQAAGMQVAAQSGREHVVLTPKASPSPRINGPRVYGQRPGADFRFKVPVSGARPVRITASSLPKGLAIDPSTGIICGSVRRSGTYCVTLHASNAYGECSRELRIEIGDDRLCLTPPMGWSSWNCFGNTVSEEHVRQTIDAFVRLGLDQYGWTYVNIDDGWQYVRDPKRKSIVPNSKFSDMKALADYAHERGLKLGIYSGPWIGTYAGHVGESCDSTDMKYFWIEKGECDVHNRIDDRKYGWRAVSRFGAVSYEYEDARQWAEWGIDYLKYDWNPNDFYTLKRMHDALAASGRDIVYSISNNAPLSAAPYLMRYAQCWRNTGDIRDRWSSVRKIAFDKQDVWAGYRRPGAWPDADMMVVGYTGIGMEEHPLQLTRLTDDEQYTHVSMWAMLSSPLLLGCDLTRADDFLLGLITNPEVIDINQDELGLSPARVEADASHVIYLKCLYDGTVALALVNLSEEPSVLGFTPFRLGLVERQHIRDVWRRTDIGEVAIDERWETVVAPHGVALVRLSPGNVNSRPSGSFFVK